MNSEIKLEVGKTYLNRDGDAIKIISKTTNMPLCFKGIDGDSYSANGRWSYSRIDSPYDLVREVTP